MIETTLSKVKKGCYFTFKPIEVPTENQVYVRGDYDRSSKTYEYFKFDDVNNSHFAKGSRKVYVDFIFLYERPPTDKQEYTFTMEEKSVVGFLTEITYFLFKKLKN